jgi:hypothetical protein
LPPRGVGAVTQKIAQLQGLFYLFEKYLDIPTPPVKVAHQTRADFGRTPY